MDRLSPQFVEDKTQEIEGIANKVNRNMPPRIVVTIVRQQSPRSRHCQLDLTWTYDECMVDGPPIQFRIAT